MSETPWPKCVICTEYIYEEGASGNTKYHRECHLIFAPIRQREYDRFYRRYGRPAPEILDEINEIALKLARREYAQREVAKLSD